MRSITRSHLKILNSDGYMPIELLEIILPGSSAASAIRLTSAGYPINWNGFDWTPVSMSHGDVEDMIATDASSIPSVTINITNIDLQMAAMLSKVEPEGAQVTLYQTDRRLLSNPRSSIIVTGGELRDGSLTEQMYIFQIINCVGLTERLTVPRRIYQADCNATFGSKSCGVNLLAKPFSYATLSQAGTTQESVYIDNATLAIDIAYNPTEFWANGYILFTSGPCTLQARPIQSVVGNRVFFRTPFFSNPGVGNNMIIRRGCRKTKQDCNQRQSNVDNFQGFEGVPYGRVIPTIVDGQG